MKLINIKNRFFSAFGFEADTVFNWWMETPYISTIKLSRKLDRDLSELEFKFIISLNNSLDYKC